MLNNKLLFDECFENLAINVDPYNRKILNKTVIPIDSTVPSELLARNTILVELLQQFNNYNVRGDNTHNLQIIDEIDECLNFEGMNYCPFSQYLMVHDVNYEMYLKMLAPEDKEFIIKCYLEDRHQMYLNRDYSEMIFQVMSDNYSHKRKGKLGVKKIKRIFEDFGLEKINNIKEIDNEKYYILPDSDGKKIFKEILDKYRINFEFEKTHQGKMPDALIKYKDYFLIIEHKTSKELGGGQDKQMTEIIDFVGYGERFVYYVSYLDGILFNKLKDPRETNKLFRDKQNIYHNLETNPYNFFVNDYGFNKLLKSILEKGQ